MAKYELLADEFHPPTNKPGEPFTYESFYKGDKVELNDEQARRLIEAGAVKPNTSTDDDEEPGAQPKAPKGKAVGVGDGDAKEGTIGDGGPVPAGSGSSVVGLGGGPGDGQGSAAKNPAASVTPGDDNPSQGTGPRPRRR
jgi:hypothetical protein